MDYPLDDIKTTETTDSLRRYSHLLARWFWLLLLSTLLFVIAALLFSLSMTPIYQASTTLLINEAPANRSADYASILTSERLARTYSEMLTKKPVLDGVISDLNLDISSQDLKKAIQVDLIRDTQLIVIKIEDSNPVLAASIANSLFEKFAEQTRSLQTTRYAASKNNLEEQLTRIDEQIQNITTQLEELNQGENGITVAKIEDSVGNNSKRDGLEASLTQYRQTYASLLQSYEQVRIAEAASISNVVQIEAAIPPEKSVRPRILLNSILAGLVGLFTACGVVLFIEANDDTIRDPEDIRRELNLPILGLITHHEFSEGKPISLSQPRAPVSEAFRSLRTNLQFTSVDKPLKTLLVTSPSPSDGKTTITTNLGVVLAHSGRQVILIDADLRRPYLHKQLKISNRKGFSDLFVQANISMDGTLQKTDVDNLMVITAGDLPPNPAELLGSAKLREIIELLSKKSDLVIFDSPPIMAVTDSAILANQVDGVLLVIKPGETKMAASKQAIEQLKRVGASILGVVLNDVDFSGSRYSYYHYKGYYYTYHYLGDETVRKEKGTKKLKNTHTEVDNN